MNEYKWRLLIYQTIIGLIKGNSCNLCTAGHCVNKLALNTESKEAILLPYYCRWGWDWFSLLQRPHKRKKPLVTNAEDDKAICPLFGCRPRFRDTIVSIPTLSSLPNAYCGIQDGVS